MTRRGNVEKIILDFAKAVCEGERTMIDEKKVELMKKLQRLAERGVGGEKEGAQKKWSFKGLGGVSRVLQSSVW